MSNGLKKHKDGDNEAVSAAGAARRYAGFLALLVAAVCRRAWLVLIVVLAATAAVLGYTANNIVINTNTGDLIANDLPFRQDYLAYKRAFPQFSDNLVIVIDGDSPDAADEAAAALSARLAEDKTAFPTVFYPEGEAFFRRNGLLYLDLDELQGLSDRLAEAQPLLTSLAADMSLRGLLDVLTLATEAATTGNAAAAGLDPMLRQFGVALDARLGGRGFRLSWVEMLRGGNADPADRRRLVVTQPALDWNTLKPAAAAMARVRAMGHALGITPENDLRLRLTGSAAINTEELESVAEGAGVAGLLSVGLVLAFLMLGLRSPRLVVAAIMTLFVGLIWTAGFAIFFVGYLNMISVAFAVLFIGLGVDFGIHFSLRYQEARAHGDENGAALVNAVTSVGGALTLCAISAAAAFLSFLPTDYKGVSELGLISGTGMFVALVANFTVLPALLSVIPGKTAAARGSGRDLALAAAALRGFESFIRHHSPAIVYVALAVGLGAAVLAVQIRFDVDPLNLKDPKKESVQTVFDLMQNKRNGADTLSVLTPDMAAAEDLARGLEALPEVDRAAVLSDFVPKDQDAKLAVIDNMALFLTPLLIPSEAVAAPSPEQKRAALVAFRRALETLTASGKGAEVFKTDIKALAGRIARFEKHLDANSATKDAELAALEKSVLDYLPGRIDALRASLEAGPVGVDDLPAGIRDRQVAADGRARIEVFPAEMLVDNDARRRFVDAVRRLAPRATDASVVLLEAGNAIVGAFQQATLTALVLILILLAVMLRTAWDIALVLIPLALAAAYTLGGAVLMGMSLNFANIIALPLLLGLGVASAIHLVLREHEAEGGIGAGGLLESSTPRAVLFSALTTIGSFGSLAISSHRGTASMGALLTLALAMTLICALVVLPAFMNLRNLRRIDKIAARAAQRSK